MSNSCILQFKVVHSLNHTTINPHSVWLFRDGDSASLWQAHSTIMSTMTESQCQPVLSTAEDIAFEVMGEIQLKGLTEPDAVELFRLLQTPHMLVSRLGCCLRSVCMCVLVEAWKLRNNGG